MIYFLHIPKTAGTTISTILDSWFAQEKVLQDNVWDSLIRKWPLNLDQYELIRGHFGYGLQYNLKSKPQYITFLRNPAERTVSQYNHLLHDPRGNQWVRLRLEAGETISLKDILQSEARQSLFNVQICYLGIDVDVIKNNYDNWKKEQKLFVLNDDAAYKNKATSIDSCYVQAREHLLSMPYFGMQEELEKSILLMCYTFGKPYPKEIPHLMVLDKRPSLSQFDSETLALIDKSNLWDYKLYYEAKQVFRQRFNSMCEELSKKSGKVITSFDEAKEVYEGITE